MAQPLSEARFIRIFSQNKRGFRPLFNARILWPFQICDIAAECVTTRELTLLEKFILKGYNEISNTTAAEIAEQLGLFEPMLIENTIDNLQSSGSLNVDEWESETEHEVGDWIEETDDEDWSEEECDLETEDEYAISPRIERLVKGMERLKRLCGKLTDRGKKNLLRGKIDNPPETKKFRLWRSLIGGSIFPQRGRLNIDNTEEPSDDNCCPNVMDTYRDNIVYNLGDSQVEKTLRKSRDISSGIEVKAQRMEDPDDDFIGWIPIYATLALDKKGKHRWFIHIEANRETDELSKELAQESNLISELIQRYSTSSGSLLKTGPDSQFIPFQILDFELEKLLNRANVLITGNKPRLRKQPVQGKIQALEKHINSFNGAIFTISKTIRYQDSINSYRRLVSGFKLNDGTYITDCGSLVLNAVELTIDGKKQSFPVVTEDKELFNKTVTVLYDKLDSLSRFKLLPGELTFNDWFSEKIKKASITQLKSSVKEAFSHLSKEDTELIIVIRSNVFHYLQTRILKTVKKKKELMTLLKTTHKLDTKFKLGIWQKLDHIVNQLVYLEGQKIGALESWIDQKKGSITLPWEDAAALDNHLFGYCNDTIHRLFKEMEQKIREEASSNKVIGGSLFDYINGLKERGAISKNLARRLDEFRRKRNDLEHEGFERITLKVAKQYIAIGRSFYKGTEGKWSIPMNLSWESVLTLEEFENRLDRTNELVADITNTGLSVNGDIWYLPLANSYPKNTSGLNPNTLSKLHTVPDTDYGMSSGTFREEISMKMVNSEIINEVIAQEIMKNGFPQHMDRGISALDSMGLTRPQKALSDRIMVHIQVPVNGTQFLTLWSSYNTLEHIFSREKVSQKMNQALASKQFNCTWKEFRVIVNKCDSGLSKRNRNRLAIRALDSQLREVRKSEKVKDIQNMGKKIEKALKNINWKEPISKTDGWLSGKVIGLLNEGNEEEKKNLVLALKKVRKGGTILPNEMKKSNVQIDEFIRKHEKE